MTIVSQSSVSIDGPRPTPVPTIAPSAFEDQAAPEIPAAELDVLQHHRAGDVDRGLAVVLDELVRSRWLRLDVAVDEDRPAHREHLRSRVPGELAASGLARVRGRRRQVEGARHALVAP